MHKHNTTAGTLEEANEEFLTYTASDKELEIAAEIEKAVVAPTWVRTTICNYCGTN